MTITVYNPLTNLIVRLESGSNCKIDEY